MKIDTLAHRDGRWQPLNSAIVDKGDAQLVLVFGVTDAFKQPDHYLALRGLYPQAHILGCTSSGNILNAAVDDARIVATAVHLEHSRVALAAVDFDENSDVQALARQLVERLEADDLRHIFAVSNGLEVNGSMVVRGLNHNPDVRVSGGMAGDGDRFQETWVIADDVPRQRRIAAVGFYGDRLSISTGSFGGWSEFGADRVVTRSQDNVLYELDGAPALDLYKGYLGEYADDLPNSGMRFPLSIRAREGAPEVIRTLLAIDEQTRSITFAGDVPEGHIVRLMQPDIDALIDGAGKAAGMIQIANDRPALGVLVSCVGRRIVMGPLVDEELEEVEQVLGANVQLTGFYSYGEIAPAERDGLACDLHNQTMTLTAIYED